MERNGLTPGSQIGGYTVVAPLGSGGMGTVYRVADGGGNEVALKLLHPHVASDAVVRARLMREVAALQKLRHPAVAAVLDAEADSTEAFLVTELVAGRTLTERVRDGGPLPASELVSLAEGLRSALAAVHAAGVVHRDLKPSNVLLTDDGPVLIDFGLAQGADDTADLTAAGFVLGTPGYLAPELLDGGEPGAATDLWGWAALLAFAATGRDPFGTRPIAAVLARARDGDVDLDGVEPLTRAAIAGALRPDPADRSAPQDVVTALRKVATHGEQAPGAVPTVALAAGAAAVAAAAAAGDSAEDDGADQDADGADPDASDERGPDGDADSTVADDDVDADGAEADDADEDGADDVDADDADGDADDADGDDAEAGAGSEGDTPDVAAPDRDDPDEDLADGEATGPEGDAADDPEQAELDEDEAAGSEPVDGTEPEGEPDDGGSRDASGPGGDESDDDEASDDEPSEDETDDEPDDDESDDEPDDDEPDDDELVDDEPDDELVDDESDDDAADDDELADDAADDDELADDELADDDEPDAGSAEDGLRTELVERRVPSAQDALETVAVGTGAVAPVEVPVHDGRTVAVPVRTEPAVAAPPAGRPVPPAAPVEQPHRADEYTDEYTDDDVDGGDGAGDDDADDRRGVEWLEDDLEESQDPDEDGPWYERPPARRRWGSLLALGLVTVLAGMLYPVLTVAVVLLLVVAVRTVGLTVEAMYGRRERRGVRRSDGTVAVLSTPWYLLRAVLGVVPALLIGGAVLLIVAGVGWWQLDSGRWVVGGSPGGEAPQGRTAGLLVAALVVIAVVFLWWGPLSRMTRTGARRTLAAVAPGPVGALVVVVLALVAALLLTDRLLDLQAITWWPAPTPILPSP